MAQVDPESANQPRVEVDDEAFETDSAYGNELSTYTVSLTSSVVDYRQENGRRYHGYRDGRYLVPNDEQEADRLDMSFHHSEWIAQMCADMGVKLVYLPPYLLDLNPIEEFFVELKSFIKRNWSYYEVYPDQEFDAFLTWCIDVVGAKEESARGHFRHAGLKIKEVSESCWVQAWLRTSSPRTLST